MKTKEILTKESLIKFLRSPEAQKLTYAEKINLWLNAKENNRSFLVRIKLKLKHIYNRFVYGNKHLGNNSIFDIELPDDNGKTLDKIIQEPKKNNFKNTRGN